MYSEFVHTARGSAQRGHKKALELQVVVNCPTWVLGTEPVSSSAVSALICQAIASSPIYYF